MVPVSDVARDMTPGRFGILEPRSSLHAAARELLLGVGTTWIVPGVAFDGSGNRIGRGGGYYDRLLRDVAGAKVGVCYEWQILPQLPHAAHDVRVDIVVSDKEVRFATPRRGECEPHEKEGP